MLRMARKKPATRPLRIGISARLLHQVPPELGFRNKTLQYLEQSLAHWIMEHGAIAFMIPAVAEGSREAVRHLSIDEFAIDLDGLVLQGGADVCPESYGQEPLDPRWSGDPIRDRYELALIWAMLAQGKPVIGICRGCQLLNVAFGGTLYQDLGTQRPDARAHLDADLYDQLEHDIRLVEGTPLAKLYPPGSQLRVTSIHHQAIDRIGKHVEVEAYSAEDDVIEAIRWTGGGYARGLQWHPEFHHARSSLVDSSPVMLDFLEVARQSALKRLDDPDNADRRIPRPPVRLTPAENRVPAPVSPVAKK
jgi:putative glutamine amidotransferase